MQVSQSKKKNLSLLSKVVIKILITILLCFSSQLYNRNSEMTESVMFWSLWHSQHLGCAENTFIKWKIK